MSEHVLRRRHPIGGVCCRCKRRECLAVPLIVAYEQVMAKLDARARAKWEASITEAQDECSSISKALRAPS